MTFCTVIAKLYTKALYKPFPLGHDGKLSHRVYVTTKLLCAVSQVYLRMTLLVPE